MPVSSDRLVHFGMLTYLGWEVICKSCGNSVVLTVPMRSEARLVLYNHGWNLYSKENDGFTWWYCPYCLQEIKNDKGV